MEGKPVADDGQPTAAQIMARIPEAFQADQAVGLTAIYQWDLADEGGGLWHVDVADGTCTVHEGQAENPNITISVSADNFVRLITGKLDGTMAFMTGKLKIKGDMGLAMRLQTLFRAPNH